GDLCRYHHRGVVRVATGNRLSARSTVRASRDRAGDAVLHVIYGEDEFRASEAVHALQDAIDSDGSLATNTSVLPARGLTPQTLVQHAAAMPFLAPARLVIVEGLLSSLGGRRGVVEAWQPFLDFLPSLPDTNHVVLLEPPPKRNEYGGTATTGVAR